MTSYSAALRALSVSIPCVLSASVPAPGPQISPQSDQEPFVRVSEIRTMQPGSEADGYFDMEGTPMPGPKAVSGAMTLDFLGNADDFSVEGNWIAGANRFQPVDTWIDSSILDFSKRVTLDGDSANLHSCEDLESDGVEERDALIDGTEGLFEPQRVGEPGDMVLVEGGTLSMSMGTRTVETFHIGRYAVTWGEWQEVQAWGEANGYSWKDPDGSAWGDYPSGCAEDHPVQSASWYDVVKWCNAKSEMDGLTPVYTVSGAVFRSGEPTHTAITQNLSANGYRLPLEAEWEFAARGGNETSGYTYAGSDDLDEVGWYFDNSAGAACDLWQDRGTWPVGQKAANELGLYDMSGNVWEWCWNQDGTDRILRGGAWDLGADFSAVSANLFMSPLIRFDALGFRLARSSEREPMVFVEGGRLSTGNELDGTPVADFFMGRHEVTWGEWREVRDWAVAHGYDLGGAGAGCADNHPVHSVNWFDAVKWCNAKSEMEGLTPVYRVGDAVYRAGEAIPYHALSADGYRLPLEAEWEFAARGGNQTSGYSYAGSNILHAVAWYAETSGGAACDLASGRGTWPVGQKTANELGLHDLSGNVAEWCWDETVFSWGSARRMRGGAWESFAAICAVAHRSSLDPGIRSRFSGLRLARSTGNFVAIPAGTYARGDHKNESESWMARSRPVHDVYVSAFYMAQTPVTYAEWKEVYDWAVANGYTFDSAGQRGSDSNFNALPDTPENNQHPVTEVSWYDVVKWSNAKSEREGLTPVYYTNDARTTVYRQGRHDVTIAQVNWSASGYRLPTEAEWEKAARGGLVGARWPWGDAEIDGTRANYWNSGGTNGTTPVGSYAANGYELYDMAGNVWEWNWDRFSDTWYSQAGATEADTRGPVSGSLRVRRGGSWSFNPESCRVAYRFGVTPESRWLVNGFRLARTQ